jgi:DNA polymerase-3 subunit beta
MNIECTKEKLARALSKVEKITAKNITLPVLSCVLLDVSDSVLTIKATNLDLGIEISLPVKMNKPGKVAVPGTILNNFISNISGDKNVVLETISGNLKVSTKHSESIIKTFSVDDFPNIPKVSDEKPIVFPTTDFLKGLRSVMYAASTSTIRPVLSSVFIYPDDEMMFFVSTDSFRLAEEKIKVKKNKDFGQILIPFKNISEIIRILEDIREDIEVYLNKNQIAFKYGEMYLTSRVIDGTFPDYKQLIPKETKTEVTVLKQDLVSALKISNIFSDKFSQVTFNVSPASKKFEIKTKNMDIGENVSQLDAILSGDEINLSFNLKYIVDCFQSINSDSVALSFSDNNRPMIIKGVSDKNFTYLVMPMNK